MQKYLNYVTVYTFVNIYQDLLIFNNYEHFYYENTSYSLYAIHEYNIYIYNVIYDLANLAIQYSKSHRRSLKIGIVGFAFTPSNSI